MFNKLFTKILDSSIWLEPTPTRIVWITLLAAMDEDGYAHFSAIENLASRARVTPEEAAKAVECFLAPDENSANPDNDGRRVERVPGGFVVLNAKVHREAMSRVIQREQTRLRVAKFRAKNSPVTKSVTEMLPNVTPASASASASESGKGSEEGKPAVRFTKPTIEEVKLAASKCGLPENEALKFFDYYESNGWRVGKNPMRSWLSALANWQRTWKERTYENTGRTRPQGVNRNAGTYNENRQANYDLRVVKPGRDVPNAQRPGPGKDVGGG